MIELVRISPNIAVPGFEAAPRAQPLPLAACWVIWFAASAGLWLIALRAAAFIF